ncbi:Crp/Fnr family transcriptional regulator [Mycobacterium colombiense]|uniref:Crp/Fnr family transcriptional regulator n=1 Tax=Mycobacterium colombiense TaxID=339268 RepID=A0A329KIX6_9MYCO|nr:Crp/Fnr family transcriptional regulator [Mycobacterium colombiense]RAU94662.1 Crp/Fnr family transcriptional regulator [Mycobacterium colombiense]
MTLLWWNTTSRIWRAAEDNRMGKASRTTASATPGRPATQRPVQQCLSQGEVPRGDLVTGDVHKALVESGIFCRTTPETVSAWAKQLAPEQFEPGCVVGAQRGSGRRLYVIISGKVKVSYRLPDGSEIILKILGRYEIFGIETLVDPGSPETSVSTLTDVLAVPIERDQLMTWMVGHPEISDQVLRLFARWADATTNSLADFAFTDTQERIASRLLCLRKRFGQREGDVVRVVHDLTLKEFARLVGVAPRTTVAILRDFEERGWIRLDDNSVVIVDGHALASLGLHNTSEASCA